MSKTDSAHLMTYESLGLEISNGRGKEHTANCPFCGSDGKVYINQDEGFFDCKACGASGNKYTFLQLHYDACRESTTSRQRTGLSRQRNGLAPAALNDLAYDEGTGKWLIPIRNERGSMVNLRQWDRKSNILFSTGGCKAHIYNIEHVAAADEVFICEGEWDALALQYMFKKAKHDAVCVAVPGAGTFKQEWAEHFKDKHVRLVYDNDDPGKKGQERTLGILREHTHCKSIAVIEWPESYPDKYDIRDYVTTHTDDIRQACTDLMILIKDVPAHNRKLLEKDIHTFQEVVEEYQKHIYLPEDMQIGLLLQFAVIFSNSLEGDPLWLFIVGPPGSGKTMMLQSLSETDETFFQSTFSAKCLVSGWKSTDGSDPSIIPQIIGKTLIIKDYTEVMDLGKAEQDSVIGTLRGAYDGRIERIYGAGVKRVYPDPNSSQKTCHFSILSGVTNAIHGDNNADMGERFLKYQLVQNQSDLAKYLEAAINNAINSNMPEFELREVATSFIQNKTMTEAPTVPDWIQQRIIGLAQIVAVVRAVVDRKQGELVYRPSAEVGTRLSKQLIRMGQCIAFTLDKDIVDNECYQYMKRVALDTCYGWHRDVILAIAEAGEEGITRNDICKKAVLSSTSAHRCIEDLYELHAIESEEKRVTKRGRPEKHWRLTESLESLWDLAKMTPEDNPLGNRGVGRIKKDGTTQSPKRRRRRANPNFSS